MWVNVSVTWCYLVIFQKEHSLSINRGCDCQAGNFFMPLLFVNIDSRVIATGWHSHLAMPFFRRWTVGCSTQLVYHYSTLVPLDCPNWTHLFLIKDYLGGLVWEEEPSTILDNIVEGPVGGGKELMKVFFHIPIRLQIVNCAGLPGNGPRNT